MAEIPLDQKFQTISGFVPTVDKRSAQINAKGATYTMQDIVDTVGGGGGGVTGSNIEFVVRETPVSAVGEAEGIVVKIGPLGNPVTPGFFYTFAATTATWVPVNSGAEATTRGLIGLSLGTTVGDGMLISGVGHPENDPVNTGLTLYVGNTDGNLTDVVPVSGTVRLVGYGVGGGTGNVYINPSQTYLTLA